MENYIIRLANREDSGRIWKIRNHPLTRQNSSNSKKIPFEKHDQWFENKYFKDSNNICFVLETRKNIIGYCRFDIDDDNKYVISIALDYDWQSKGLGHLLLSESLKKIEGDREILATVKKGNPASLNLFQRNNFKLDKENEENYFFIFKT